jgi:hypothetical protein
MGERGREGRKSRADFEVRLAERAWSDEGFKRELIDSPRDVVARELDIRIPDDIEIQVLEETPQKLYIVLPPRPTWGDERYDVVAANTKWIFA